MFKDLEEQSHSLGKQLSHPNISFVKILSKRYFCEEHEYMRLNSGTAKQHIQGPYHELDFETGKPLFKKNSSMRISRHRESFRERERKLKAILPKSDLMVKYLLIEFGFEKELQPFLMELVLLEAYLYGTNN